MRRVQTQVWLRANRRAILVNASVLALGAIILAGLSVLLGEAPQWIRWTLAVSSLVAAIASVLVLLTIRIPRVAYADGVVFFYLGEAQPVKVPLGAVECFFLGQGPLGMPGTVNEKVQTANVIVRLAERATDWQARDTPGYLATWCDGYITIRGTWCERISPELVKRLNHDLALAKRQDRTTLETNASSP